jgi:uncharacterized protein (TIGR03067 family)
MPTVTSCVATLILLADANAAFGENNGLNGSWRLISVQSAGQEVESVLIEGRSVLFDGNKATFRIVVAGVHERVFESEQEIELGRSGKVGLINFTSKDGERKAILRRGIFELKGTQLKICLAESGQARPTHFQSSEKNGWLVHEYARISEPKPEKKDRLKPEARMHTGVLDIVSPNCTFSYRGHCRQSRRGVIRSLLCKPGKK